MLLIAKECKSNTNNFIQLSFVRTIDSGNMYCAIVPFVRFHSTCDDLLGQTCCSTSPISSMSYTIVACTHVMSTLLLFQGTQC
jgi:hypothetical protein